MVILGLFSKRDCSSFSAGRVKRERENFWLPKWDTEKHPPLGTWPLLSGNKKEAEKKSLVNFLYLFAPWRSLQCPTIVSLLFTKASLQGVKFQREFKRALVKRLLASEDIPHIIHTSFVKRRSKLESPPEKQ